MFEPSGVGDAHLFKEAVEVSHIVKYSHDRLGGESMLDDRVAPLQVETLGRNGLRYRGRLSPLAKKGWANVPGFVVDPVQDTCGAGDWCSAGILHVLGRRGARGLLEARKTALEDALRFGQALSAWTCGFEGARGGMYEIAPEEFRRQVEDILADGGARPRNADMHASLNSGQTEAFCALCQAR